MPEITLLEAVQQGLNSALEADPQVVIIGNDIGALGGVFRTTEGLLAKYGAERIIEAPLAGAATIGVAIGLALYGMHPICEIQSAEFLFSAFQGIVNEAARMCYRSNGAWNLPLVIRAPYGGGSSGGLYHSQSVEAFFSHVPGLKVIVPSNPYDAKGLLLSAVDDRNPVLFLEPRQGYRSLRGVVPLTPYRVPLGKAQVTRPGEHLSLFTYGMMHSLALQAADAAAGEGISIEVVDLRCLSPFDRETILDSVRKTRKALILHEDSLSGGVGAEVAALIAAGAFTSLDAPIKRLGGPDIPAVPFSPTLQEWYMPSLEKILRAARFLASY